MSGRAHAASTARPSLPYRSVPEERRLVTVLFADVTESTELGEALDPEDLRTILSRYYAHAKDAVAAHAGSVEKFIGDAVLAVFGMPVAHGDDPARALSAALELRERVRADRLLGERLRLRFGVNTGEVVANLDGADVSDFLITGDAVNVAARLQQAAPPWAILCAERTVRAAGSSFAFGPSFGIEVKGKRARVRVAKLLGRAAPIARPKIPLFGRDTELAQLELVARRALADRRPSLVSIVAPAGTGKTRLLEEFLEGLPALAPDATVATAQCLPYGQRLTYWPLRTLLLRVLRLDEDASATGLREATRAWLAESGTPDAERIAELLAATVGVGEEEVSDRGALLAAWRRAAELAARTAPLVVVLEDLHWSSDSLLELVEHVAQSEAELPILMIALARPELLDRRPGWGGGQRNYAALSLEPLSDAAVGRIVTHLLEAGPPEIVERVVARAEGNPFFAGELVRALLDRVSSLDDVGAVEAALQNLPDSVQGTVLARVDHLPGYARRVLQLGAVLGRTFRVAAISALAPELEPQLDAAIEVLLARDLVRPAEPGTFVFRHILIREVAYGTLPRAARAPHHAAAARWLESRALGSEDVFAELIAYHYREAATLASAVAPEEAPAAREKAVAWLTRAAEVALAGAANLEAVSHLRAAIGLAEQAQLPDLYERIGDVFTSVEAVDAYRVALELRRASGSPPEAQLRAVAGMLHVYLRSGGSAAPRPPVEEVLRLRAEGEALAKAARDESVIARFLAADALYPFWVRWYAGATSGEDELARAEANARRALAVGERTGDVKLQSIALDALSAVLSLRGNARASRELARRRIAMGESLDLVERLDAHTVATWMSSWLGDLDDAIETSAAAVAMLRRGGQAPAWALHLYAWRTLALARRGRWDEALASGQQMRALWVEAARLPATYALGGFVAALAVARWRGNEELFERFRATIREIKTAFGPVAPQRRPLAFLSANPNELDYYLRDVDQRSPETVELALAFASDAGRPPGPRLLVRLSANPAYAAFPMVEGEIQRALGIARRDPAPLGRALELFERCGAAPSVARARCERALLTGDAAELRRGLDALADLGDVVLPQRYARHG